MDRTHVIKVLGRFSAAALVPGKRGKWSCHATSGKHVFMCQHGQVNSLPKHQVLEVHAGNNLINYQDLYYLFNKYAQSWYCVYVRIAKLSLLFIYNWADGMHRCTSCFREVLTLGKAVTPGYSCMKWGGEMCFLTLVPCTLYCTPVTADIHF